MLDLHIGRRIALPFIVLSVLSVAGQPAWGDSYSFTTLSAPGATGTYADSINSNGQVAGWTQSAGGQQGFVDSSGSFTAINPSYGPLDNSYYGTGINDGGQIVGNAYITDPNGRIVGNTGFLDTGGTFTELNGPGGAPAELLGINNSAQVIGFFSGANGTQGFVDSGGVYTVIQDPLSSGASIPFGINNSGQIVGWFDEGAATHGYLYTNGAFVTIEDPSAPNATYATGINDLGQIVGYYSDATGYHGFVDANGVYTTIDDPNAGSVGGTFAYAINDNGQIVGQYGSQSFLATDPPTPVPEAGTLALLAISLIAVTVIFYFDSRKILIPPTE